MEHVSWKRLRLSTEEPHERHVGRTHGKLPERERVKSGSWMTHSSKWRNTNVFVCILLLFLKTLLYEILWNTT
jgi:hypothetical protein